MGIDEIQDYVNGLNLGDWDLDGVEITLEDCYAIQTLMEEGMGLEEATQQVLCDIRDCLDGGLDEVGYSDDVIEDVNDIVNEALLASEKLAGGVAGKSQVAFEK